MSVHCPRTNNVLAMYWVSTSPLAPSDSRWVQLPFRCVQTVPPSSGPTCWARDTWPLRRWSSQLASLPCSVGPPSLFSVNATSLHSDLASIGFGNALRLDRHWGDFDSGLGLGGYQLLGRCGGYDGEFYVFSMTCWLPTTCCWRGRLSMLRTDGGLGVER